MRNIKQFINEMNDGIAYSFKEKVKYSNADWDKWIKMWKDNKFGNDILVGELNDEPNLELVYKQDHKEKVIRHIATYNTKTQVLCCDDIKLFGHEK